MTILDLTGTWAGHYWQNGRRHGIRMQIVQRGRSFVGRMRDEDTLMATRETVRAPSPRGDGTAGELIGEAEVLSTLPEFSSVEGEVEGQVVTFVKSYQGKSSMSVWVADKATMTFESPGHQVHYRGTLSADGALLRGLWRIPGPRPGSSAQRDRFDLRHIDTHPPMPSGR